MHVRVPFAAWVVAHVFIAPAARAAFWDLTTVQPGVNGGNFAGMLDGVALTGQAFSTGIYFVNAPGTGFSSSTVNGTSPQYSYANVYDPVETGVDRVGYSAADGSNATVTIAFGSPVTNPRFHVAELAGAKYTFTLTGGLTGISLVRGNGGDGDGLQVVGNVVSDANPATYSLLDPTIPLPTTGSRAAFGTVLLNGTFTALSINVRTVGGDGGSFALSGVPEPTAVAVVGTCGLALLRRRRRTSIATTACASTTSTCCRPTSARRSPLLRHGRR